MKWRVYIGDDDYDDPDWMTLDQRGLTWEQARDLLAEHIRPFLDDECPWCRDTGTDGHAQLVHLKPGTTFRCDIDGDLYAILEDVPAPPKPPSRPGKWVDMGYTTDGAGIFARQPPASR